jgi:hypothetical protein
VEEKVEEGEEGGSWPFELSNCETNPTQQDNRLITTTRRPHLPTAFPSFSPATAKYPFLPTRV